jgi:hypothetical protein
MPGAAIAHAKPMTNFLQNRYSNVFYAGLIAVVMTTPMLAAAGTPKIDATQTKVNVYVSMLNSWWTKRMHTDQRTYASWVANLDTGPTCKEPKIKSWASFDVSKDGLDVATTTIAKKPSLATDAAAATMLATATTLSATINEASEYYTKKTFKTDNCKRGKEMHRTLVDGWKAFFDAEGVVRVFVVDFNDANDLKLLVAAKKTYGEGFRYHLEKQLGDAKMLIRELDTQFNADKPDVAAVTARIDALSATLDATEALIAKVKDVKTGNSKKVYDELYRGGYEATVRASRDLQKYAKSAVDAYAATVGKQSDKSLATTLDNHLKNAFTAYNEMINGINKVKISKLVK